MWQHFYPPLVVICAYLCNNFLMLSNPDIEKTALDLKFSDARFAAAGDVLTTAGEIVAAGSLLRGASCIIVLFKQYVLSTPAAEGKIGLSQYYVASNEAYKAAKRLAEVIRESGADALHTASISARAAALRTGGFIGDNGLYYHERLGSLVCIQTVISAAAEPREYRRERYECLHCGACRNACAAAAGDIQGCVRAHMHGIVPQELRKDVYQLLGCERCQGACPLNDTKRSAPYEFEVIELLRGGEVARLRELAGGNMARARRIQSQAALYAGSSGMKELADDIKRLAENAEEPVRTHAQWAYKQLTGENDDNA